MSAFVDFSLTLSQKYNLGGGGSSNMSSRSTSSCGILPNGLVLTPPEADASQVFACNSQGF